MVCDDRRELSLHFSGVVPQLQAQFVVNPMRLLQIDLPCLATQKDMDAPVAVADPRGANLLDPSFKAGLLAATRFEVIAGARQGTRIDLIVLHDCEGSYGSN